MPPYSLKRGGFKPSPAMRTGSASRNKAAASAARKAIQAVARIPAAPYTSRRFARVVRDRLGENKYFDTATTGVVIGSDAAAAVLVQDLAIIPQGTTVSKRIGKKLRVMRLQVKGNVRLNAAANTSTGAQGQCVRLSVVWDREPDKAALVPVTTDVYASNSSLALTNRDNAPRFKILKEMYFDFSPVVVAAGITTTPDPTLTQHFCEYLDFSKKDLEIIWTSADTTGATAAKIKGNLLLVITANQTLATAGVFMDANWRVDFEDEASKQSKR